MTAETPPAAGRKPRIVVEFAGPGLADCQIVPDEDVTLAQLYGLAWLIDVWAREARAGQLASSATPLVAGIPDLAALLRQAGVGERPHDG